MRSYLQRLGPALLLSFLMTLAVQAADFTWLVTDRLPQALPPGKGLVAVGQERLPGIALVSGDLVSLFEIGADGALLAQGTFVAYAPLSAVALGDVDQDGRWELISARGEEGAVAVDRWVKGQRLPLGSPRYAWMPVKALQVLSTRSGRAVVAAGEAGGLLTYLVGGRSLEPAGVSEPRQRFELLGAADLDGDGQEELVAGVGRSEVAVLRWTPGTGWSRWWQNFPWGGLAGAAVGDLDRDGWAELAVASRERLLYVFGKSETGAGLTLRYQGSIPLPAGTLGLAYVAPVDGTEDGAEGLPGGVVVYNADEVRFVFLSSTLELLPGVTAAFGQVRRVLPLPESASGPAVELWPRLLLDRGDGTLELVAAVRSDQVKLVWRSADGGEVPVATPLVRDGRLYVSLQEVADLLGAAVRWNEERQTVEVGPEADGPAIELVPGQAPWIGGRAVPEAGQVFADGDQVFLEARGIGRLFPPGEGGRPQLMVVVGERRLPAAFIW